MTKKQWKSLYRQVRLGRKEVMPTSFINVGKDFSIEIYFVPKSIELKERHSK